MQESSQSWDTVQCGKVQEMQAPRLLFQAWWVFKEKRGDPKELQHQVFDGEVHVGGLGVRGSGIFPHKKV